MIRRLLPLLCLLIAAAAAQAADCTAYPANRMRVDISCPKSGGACVPGQPIQLKLVQSDSSDPVPSCVSANWAIQDKQTSISTPYPATTGSGSFTVTPPAGNYFVIANITSTPPTTTFLSVPTLSVGNGLVQIDPIPFGAPGVSEGSSATFTISRTAAPTATTVTWELWEALLTLNARISTQLTPSTGTVTLNAGETSKSFTLFYPQNSSWTGEHLLWLKIKSITNNYVPVNGYNDSVSFRVLDDDWALISAEAAPKIKETAASGTVTIRRSNNLELPVAVQYSTSGPNFGPASGTLNFAANETAKSITVPIVDDNLFNPDPMLNQIRLSSPTFGAKIADPLPLIDENEPVSVVSITGVSSAELHAGQHDAAFTVKLTPGIATPVSLNFELLDGSATFGSDYSGTRSGSIWFDAAHSVGTIPFQIVGDSSQEPNETVMLRLSQYDGASPRLTMPPDGTATILNDDAVMTPPNAQIARGETMRFAVDIGLAATSALTLPISASDPSIVSFPAVRISAGQSRASFDVTGVKAGSTRITAALPDGQRLSSTVTVNEPVTPALASVEPASGDVSGGTPFIARGSLLTADCRLLFGDAPATPLALTADGMLAGSTPAHPAGAVDVTLQCGSDTFVLPDAFTYTAPARRRSARH